VREGGKGGEGTEFGTKIALKNNRGRKNRTMDWNLMGVGENHIHTGSASLTWKRV